MTAQKARHSHVGLRTDRPMQDSAHCANLAKHSKTRKTSDQISTLCSLPHDIVGNIIRELSFKDKCSLELVGKEFNALLSNPSSVEGLWGTCNLMSDPNLDNYFDSKEDVMG